MYHDFLARQEIINEGPAVAAVQEMTHRLTEAIPENPYTFEITVVKSDVVNAFALPGGYIVVFTGLMKKAESPEEVSGVLAHELNHVLQRHGLERIVKQLGLCGRRVDRTGKPAGAGRGDEAARCRTDDVEVRPSSRRPRRI